VVSLDVTNTESIQAAKEKVTELTGGRLDILVNNAYAPLPKMPDVAPILKPFSAEYS
jgi:NAD(P)-dependent dehydrogenase (short-subunit alcohol dehydrogenase family)